MTFNEKSVNRIRVSYWRLSPHFLNAGGVDGGLVYVTGHSGRFIVDPHSALSCPSAVRIGRPNADLRVVDRAGKRDGNSPHPLWQSAGMHRCVKALGGWPTLHASTSGVLTSGVGSK